MSPEQARGQLTDARTDLFSLGTVLYQMATGVLPFQGDTSADTVSAILNQEPPPVTQRNPALPAELSRILSKALEKDRNLRCQTATELKTDLLRLKRDADSGGRRAAELDGLAQRRPEGRRAVGRGPLLREPQRREGGRVPPRRRHRGHHHGAVEDQGAQGPVPAGGAPVPGQAGGHRPGGPAAQGRLRPGRQHPPGRQPPAHHRPARGRGVGLAAVVGALRPRDGGRLRGAGRDRAQDRGGAAREALAPGGAGPRGPADGEPAGLRPLPPRAQLRAAPHPAGPRVRAADVRERGLARPRVRPRLRRRSRTSAPSTTTTTSASGSGSTARATPRARRSASSPTCPR